MWPFRSKVENLETNGDVTVYVISDKIIGIFPLKEEDIEHFKDLATRKDAKAKLTFNWTDKGEG